MMTPTNDVVLVLLPDVEPTTASGLLLAPSIPPVLTYGRVLRIGPKVRDVKPKDMVAFPPTAGDPIALGAHQAVFLRESEIAAVVDKRQELSAV